MGVSPCAFADAGVARVTRRATPRSSPPPPPPARRLGRQQLGSPPNREQYVHRTGRTGRAGKAGRAALLLEPFEATATRKELKGLPLKV